MTYYLFLLVQIIVLFITGGELMVLHFESEDDWSKVLPFYRTLKITSPLMTGKDVTILQNLLKRCPGVNLTATGNFDLNTSKMLSYFQKEMKLQPNGILNPLSASIVLERLSCDSYRDDGTIPRGIKFKIHIPVYRNRNIETTATLYAADGTTLYKFTARTHGSINDNGLELNQFTTNGNTPTGLSTMDLNSKEPNLKSFGPYPVLRVVKGIKGNSAIGKDHVFTEDGKDTFLSDYRFGILIHTGKWDRWKKGQAMPNSNGCIHVAPDDQKRIIDLLITKTKTIVNKNPFGKIPYPYKTQGIISIEQIDC